MADTTNVTVTKEPQSVVKIEGEIPFSELETHRSAALKHLGKDVEIDGFRKGHVPEGMLIKHVGEMNILVEMAERALARAYPEIVKEHKLDVVGHPQISLTKLAEGNPLGFSATVAIMPEVSLPDYQKVAAGIKKEDETVSDADLEAAIKNILRQKMAYERLQAKAAKDGSPDAAGEAASKAPEGTGNVTDLPTPESEAAKKDEAKTTEGGSPDATGEAASKPIETQEEFDALPLPELTDEYVKGLGDFSSVEDFKTKLREHLQIEKKKEVNQKHRAAITDAIIEKSTMELPQVMIDSEIDQMFAQMQEDLKRSNLTLDDYLAHVKKTKEDIAKEWQPAAEKRAKLQLVLNEIAKKENVSADPEKVEHEVAHLLEHYKDADKERVRVYVETILKNEEVMQRLEKESAE